MPWTVADVDRFKKGLTPREKRQWVEIANDVLRRCQARGGSNCEASAIRQANGVSGNSAVLVHFVITADYEIEEVTLHGKPHIKVPVVMMVEGVHDGSQGPIFHRSEVLRQTPEMWNGAVVTVQHPRQDGEFVSVYTPGIMEQYAVGEVDNAHYNDGLKADLYIDIERIENISPEALADIRHGHPLDVSVGVFNETEPITGEWHGESYEKVAISYEPDHLALLPGGRGACSFDDGCGIRANQEGGEMQTNATVTGMEAKRKELGMSVSEFYAVPRDPPSDSKLPIFDAAHVRNAMARFSQTQGLTSQERATARRKIIAKAHSFDIDTSGFEEATNNSADVDEIKQEWVQKIIQDNADLGYQELVHTLQSKLDSLDVPGERVHYLQEVYDDYLIYSVRVRGGGETLYKRGYTVSGNGVVDFGDDTPVRVQRKVNYVTMEMVRTRFNNKKEGGQSMSEEKTPCCEAKVDELIANEATPFTAKDKDWLLTLNEKQLEKVTPKEPVLQANAKEAIETFKSTLTTLDDYTSIMPAEMKARVDAGIAMIQANREALEKSITDNTDQFKPEQLKTLSDDVLKGIIATLKTDHVNYSGQGQVQVQSAGETEGVLLPAGISVNEEKKEG